MLRQTRLGRLARFLLAALSLAVGAVNPLIAQAAPRPQVELRLEPGQAERGTDARLSARLRIPEGYHLVGQAGLFGLSLDPPAGLEAGYPAPGALQLPKTEATIAGTPVYYSQAELVLPLTWPDGPRSLAELRVRLDWQICTDSGTCLRPESEIWVFPLPDGPARPLADPGSAAGQNASSPADAPAGDGSLAWPLVLLFAFIGGILLNFMPCVLPVLSLKALALLAPGASRRRHQAESLATLAGMVASLLALGGIILALKAGGQAIGWGFQFQSPWYSLGLAALILVFALSLLEVWQIPSLKLGSKKAFKPGAKGEAGSGEQAPRLLAGFLSGGLMVLLATPCTAPFLGTALGFALAAPPWLLLLSFGAIGLGLALPLFAVTLLPDRLSLPKPGPWLGRFRELMGFALLATVVWLLTVLARQLPGTAFAWVLWLLGLIALACRLFAWIQASAWGRWGRRLGAAALLAGLALFTALALGAMAKEGPAEASARAEASAGLYEPWLRFDEIAVQADIAAGRPVFIDFTAAWCLSCQLNEAGALADPRFLAAAEAAGLRLYRGDWTNPDPVISAWLKRYQRAGVPFYLVQMPGQPARVLPEILSVELLLEAVRG